MEILKALSFISIVATLLGSCSVKGQIGTPCTASMINNFTPCFNIITGSSNNSPSQTESCCSTLRSFSGVSMDCACLLLTANVPVPMPINAALSLILPSSCNMSNLPAQCKAIGTPLPAPGPISLGPSPPPPPPPAASPFSPQASKAVAVTPAPQSEASSQPKPPQLASTHPPVEAQAPTTHHRIRPVISPSGSNPSCFCPPSLWLICVAIMVLKTH